MDKAREEMEKKKADFKAGKSLVVSEAAVRFLTATLKQKCLKRFYMKLSADKRPRSVRVPTRAGR